MDSFFYRADPPGFLAGDDISVLARMQEQSGLNAVTPGTPLTPDEMKSDPHGAIERLSRDLAVAAGAGVAVKLCLPLPSPLRLDPMLLGGLFGNLIAEGASILEFDARPYQDVALDPSDDGFTLSTLMRPDGFRLAVNMGALADWSADRLDEVAAELAADRYVFTIAGNDDLSKLERLPEESLAVLGLIDPSGDIDADAVLERLDQIAEVLDQDRMALTTTGPITDTAVQQKVLTELSDISVRFFGFAV